MKQIIAMHGWSGDSSTWKDWETHFQNKGWIWQQGERGYGGMDPRMPNWHKEIKSNSYQRRVVIGHSLGPHLLHEEILAEATDLVMICSFARFIPKTPQSRVLSTSLRKMKQHIGTSKEEIMLNNFLKKATYPSQINDISPGFIPNQLSLEGRKRLKTDLDLLIHTSSLPKGLPLDSRVLVIEAKEDAIVVRAARDSLIDELKQKLNNPPTHWAIDGAGHLLLSKEIIQPICNWLEEKS